MFIEYEKDLDKSNQIIKEYEDYFGDNKTKNDILDKLCGANLRDICSENDEKFIKISLTTTFPKFQILIIVNYNQTNNYYKYCGKKYQ